ncbi:galactitol-1-phosphate 5-dehydrogenase [Vibrio sinensis]|uniref:Galactitol-1-phosphate 5-dehydrogenase n=1 Tax=Vibrio sinensis TaxID=2302434 RepID=A0A3A6QET1_9VIBR|nr:alcohol dehydrogenase catalytic domain-containing protein [Vibrio sinensis]RJX67154.1 galactitol-1-phosphate 5-dehydrogenase [Vibrio sinensis]
MNMNNHVEILENGKLQLKSYDMPEFNTDEVLIEVYFSGLCGSDVPRIFKNGAHFYPITLGHEFSGKIIAVGKDASKFSVGDRVCCAPLVPCQECDVCNKGLYSLCKNYSFVGSRRQGGNAQFVSIPQKCCFKLPETVSLVEGAFFEPITVGLHPLIMSGGCQNKHVVIIGAGTIGLLTQQAAKAMGAASVTTIDICDKKLVSARSLGADRTVNSLDEEQLAAYKIESELTPNQLIIELAGVPETLKLSLDLAGPKADVYLVGTIHKDFAIAYKEYEKILRKELSLVGSWMNYSFPYPGEEWDIACNLFSESKVDTSLLLDGIYLPEDYIARVENIPKQVMTGKILLSWGQADE